MNAKEFLHDSKDRAVRAIRLDTNAKLLGLRIASRVTGV